MISGIRAPSGHGEIACDPPLGQLANSVRNERASVHNPRFQKIRELTRCGILAELGPQAGHLQLDSHWVGLGHQPEVFHPGVWAKNFLAGGMVGRSSGPSLNLIVDTDCPSRVGINVPSLELGEWPRKARILPFALPVMGKPWNFIDLEPTVFSAFKDSLLNWANRVSWKSAVGTWFREMEPTEVGGSLPVWQVFQKARQSMEREWGLNQPGLSLAALAAKNGFRLFFDHVLSEFSFAHSCYNQALGQFRKQNGLKDSGRPVPDLERNGAWFELPFWVCLPSTLRRSRLWCRAEASGIELGATPEGEGLPEPLGRSAPQPGDLLDHHDWSNLVIWPRALATTLFLRCFVFDWFVHGIGGALYDQVTESWAKLWLGMTPGPRVAFSLTMRLPLPPPRATLDLAKSAKHAQRHLYWNPDLVLGDQVGGLSPDESRLLSAMRNQIPARGPASKKRFFDLRSIGDQLRGRASSQLEKGWEEVDRLVSLSPEEKVVNSREYAFPLHPVVELKKHLQPLLDLRQAVEG